MKVIAPYVLLFAGTLVVGVVIAAISPTPVAATDNPCSTTCYTICCGDDELCYPIHRPAKLKKYAWANQVCEEPCDIYDCSTVVIGCSDICFCTCF